MKLLKNKTLKKIDIALLILLPLLATITTLLFKLNYLTSSILFFGLISFWLSIRTPKMVTRTAIFALVFDLPVAFIVNYVAVQDGAWYVPNTIFGFRLLNGLPVEDIILGFLFVYSIVICYEHFLDKGKHRLVDEKMKYFIWPFAIALLTFFALVFTRPEFLEFKYAYTWIGTIFIALPVIASLSTFPRLFSKYVKVGVYFSLVLAMFEYTGLTLNHWIFPGQNFLGWVPFFGYRIPFEEVFFWIILSTISILSYYEFFDDDGK